ncbi:general transcription factor iih polypeptide 2 gtf2h2, partial [Cystoisospora suis]
MEDRTGSGGRDAAFYPSVEEILQSIEDGRGDTDVQAEEDIYGQYAWECEVERSWDQLVESAEGGFLLLQSGQGGTSSSSTSAEETALRGSPHFAKDKISSLSQGPPYSRQPHHSRQAHDESRVKKGIIRSLVLMIDMSEAM